ncbi:MAG: hypothetical protein ACJ757_10500 [Gaiellaceae bacterium]
MKISIIVTVLAALVAAVAASASSPINGTDRANAARACTALRAGNASAFGQQYASFGACTSQWAQKAHAARLAAQRACTAKGLKGKQYSACVKAATNTTLATQTARTKSAEKTCAAERKAIGDAAFAKKYGSNANMRNAFGKCVSQTASGKAPTGGGGGGSSTQHFSTTLTQLNSSNVSGTGTLLRNGNKLQVKLSVTGLEANQSHAIAIRGLSSGAASCPTSSADTNTDGTISLSEGQPLFGDVLLNLDPASLSASGWSTDVQSALSPLQTRTIVVLGKTVNGTYDATLPVACGTITTSS